MYGHMNIRNENEVI